MTNRLEVTSELDQMIAELADGNKETLVVARDWLADAVLDGNWEVITVLLKGWRSEMEKGTRW